jgi:uncharacterized protein YraI
MKLLRVVLVLLGAGFAAAPLSAQVAYPRDTTAYATAPVRIRQRPALNAIVLKEVAAGSPLTMGSCVDGWCDVKVATVQGYVLQEYLAFSPPTGESGPGRSYVNSKGERVQSPTRTADGQPPAGATAQCRDGAYSFSRSRRGTCSGHGGVARWL